MFRSANTKVSGQAFDQATINAVWEKARIISNNDPNVFRKDSCGAWIKKSDHGTIGQYGWEIDHIMPVAKGGTDVLSNLQPLNWSNNRHKGDTYPNWSCAVSNN